ncbi:MAG TPA: UbiA-like polyprenyltransferase [Bacteroidales bacterium]|nr:UbiA-like polyprenyltransferase [Bacteroidales bacterium]
MSQKISAYFSLIKFSHTIFAMPFALIGAVLGYKNGHFEQVPWELFGFVVLCMFFARSAAMSFNRYADAKIDSLNPRTKNREIPKGVYKPAQVLFFTVLNAVFFITTTYFINSLVFYLSPVALLVILGYSYAKRFTFLAHVWLGVALALAPLGAFMVFSASFSWIPIPFSLIVIFWVSGFDVIYSTQDAEFDQEQGLNSIPSLVGVKNALNIAFLLHLLAITGTIVTGFIFKWHFAYWMGAVIFSLMLIWEHVVVRKNHNQETVNMAFATINSYAGLLYGIAVIVAVLLAN